jgi:excisionase family DNA binding protein
MSEFLTAKDMEELLQVDRSTIYRMAEQGRLPAVKVGKQWRFPSDQIANQFGIQRPVQTIQPDVDEALVSINSEEKLAEILPLDCVQLIQDSFSELLGVMMVVTDMEGRPVTEHSNACGLFDAISQVPQAVEQCIHSWQMLATSLELEPRFSQSHLGMLCTRALIRVGTELKGMVIAGCVEPAEWPPAPLEIEGIAADLGVPAALIEEHLDEVYSLTDSQQETVLIFVQRMANIIAHVVNERKTLMDRLEAIADLTAF